VPEDEGGSTLLLLPSAVLVLFLLTALAVDGAAAFLAQRELADACASAANDAAGAALSVEGLYAAPGPGGRAVDPIRAAAIARSRLAPLEDRWGRRADVQAEASGPDVVLRLAASAPLPIGPGGASRSRTQVTATCEATTVGR